MSNTRKIVAAVVAVVVVVGVSVGGWWFFIRDDAPKEFNIEDAGETLDEEGGDSAGADTDTDGTWTIDASVGSAEDFSGNSAGYRIQEELASIGGNTAAGRTSNVTGSLTIADNQVTEGSFEVDMTTLESDESLRDSAMRGRGLETDSFPTATFTLIEPIDLPDNATSGDALSFDAVGDLTLHGVTKSITIPLEAQLDGDHIAIVGQAPVLLADYEIEKPEGFSVVSVADDGTFEFQFFLSKD